MGLNATSTITSTPIVKLPIIQLGGVEGDGWGEAGGQLSNGAPRQLHGHHPAWKQQALEPQQEARVMQVPPNKTQMKLAGLQKPQQEGTLPHSAKSNGRLVANRRFCVPEVQMGSQKAIRQIQAQKVHQGLPSTKLQIQIPVLRKPLNHRTAGSREGTPGKASRCICTMLLLFPRAPMADLSSTVRG